jgi:ADP-ribose pyrophosphatase
VKGEDVIHENWHVISSKEGLRHPFITVTMQHVQLPDGRIIEDWPIVQTRDYANALVLNEAGQAMILEGYKHGLGKSSWQVPGGYLEAGEGPLDAIKREVLEETGYTSSQWEQLGRFVVDANRHVGTAHFYLARHARQVAIARDADLEGFRVLWISIHELREALRNGQIALIAYATNIALALLALESKSTNNR